MPDDFRILLDAPDTAISRLQIAKLGDEFHHDRYGKFAITADQAETWKKNLSNLPGGMALIDEDHMSEKPSPHRDTEADGWIKDVNLEDDKVFADVEWTPKGEKAIKEKRYLFFSPAFGPYKNEKGEVFKDTLFGGGLTNKPHLNMPAIMLCSADRLATAYENESTFLLESMIETGIVQLGTISAEDREKHATVVKTVNGKKVHMFPIPPGDKVHAEKALQLLPAAIKAGHITDAEASKIRAKAHSVLGTNEKKDSPATMKLDADNLVTLGITDEASQKVILDMAETEGVDSAKVFEAIAAAQPKPAEPETKTLEQQATLEGKILLDDSAVKELVANAAAGAEAKKELESKTFEVAFEKAEAKGKVVPALKEDYEAFYALDQSKTLKMLEDNPVVINVTPTGASVSNIGEAPSGTSQGTFELDYKAQEVLKEKEWPASKYEDALTIVLESAGA